MSSNTLSKYGYVFTGVEGGIHPAHFSSYMTSVIVPLTVLLHNDDGEAEISCEWDFGGGTIFVGMIDNNESASPYVSNTYGKYGNYTVTLTVYGHGGNSILIKDNNITSQILKFQRQISLLI